MIAHIGTRPVIVAGALLASGGVYYLSRIPVHGSYVTDLLPGLVTMAIGLGSVFVGVTTAANAGVPSETAGLAASLLNASQQLGAALGLAIFAAIATSQTDHLLAAHTAVPDALTSGFQKALLASSAFLLFAAAVATRTASTRGEVGQTVPESLPELARI
jgi:MFS family permease